MKRLLILPGLFLAIGMLADTGMAQEDPEVNELRERISATVGELKQAEQTGRKEVAAELRRKVEDLEKALMQRRKETLSSTGPPAAEMRLRAMKEKLEQLRREGLADKAEQLQAEIDQFMARSEAERAEAAAREHAREAERKAREMHERAPREPGPPPEGDLERRMHHLRVAVENLHAAGLHDPAEKIAQMAEEMRRNLERQGPPPEPRPELQDLRHHVEVLTDRVRRLEETVERLQNERR